MDPLCDKETPQVLDIKAFLNLFGNDNLFRFSNKACININSILHGVFEGLESQLLDYKSILASKIAKTAQAALDDPKPSVFSFFSDFKNFNTCLMTDIPKSSYEERL